MATEPFFWTGFAGVMSGAAAVGTGALAWFTKGLAKETKKVAKQSADSLDIAKDELKIVAEQAAATRQQAEAATRTLQSELTPWIVPVVQGDPKKLGFNARDSASCEIYIGFQAKSWEAPYEKQPHVWAIVPIRNVGKGIARIREDSCGVVIYSKVCGAMETFGRATSLVIAPNEGAHLVFHAPKGGKTILPNEDVATFGSTSQVVVVIRYSDIHGAEKTVSRFHYRGITPIDLLDYENPNGIKGAVELFDPSVTIEDDPIP